MRKKQCGLERWCIPAANGVTCRQGDWARIDHCRPQLRSCGERTRMRTPVRAVEEGHGDECMIDYRSARRVVEWVGEWVEWSSSMPPSEP
jgi:hypothetical protein